MKGQHYELADIQKLYIELANNSQTITSHHLKDNLANMTRILVWDDQHNTDLFDSYVCEVKMLEKLLDIFGSTRDKEVVNAILGFFTILLSNLNRQPSLNYILSHGVTTCLTMTKFGNMNNEIADYYINFLKVLSRKITSSNLHIFYHERYPTFPILSQTIRFFNHPESLVRTTCRNIILTFAKLKNPLVDKFMTNFPFVTYYVHESNFLKEYWVIIDKILRDKEDNQYELAHLENLFQDHEEVLIFIDDMINLNQPGVVECFMSAFLNQCLSPLIRSLDTEAKECFSIQLCLYILIFLFKTFSNPFVLDTMALVVLGKYHTKSLANTLFDPVPCLLSYDKKWKFKGFWDSHEEKVRLFCAENYAKFTNRKLTKENTSEISPQSKVETKAIFGTTNNFYEREIEKIENIFGLNIMTVNHDNRSVGGIHIRDILKALESNNTIDIEDCEINSISNAIESYLISKDDTLVLLTLTLYSTIFQSKSISPSVLDFCKLSLKPSSKNFQSIIKIEKLIINSLKIFSVDPPCFRMCTYVEASDLLKKLLEFYKINDLPLSEDVLSALKLGLKTTIDRVSPYLFSGKEWENVMTMYLQAERYCSKRRFKNLKTYGFLPTDEDITNLITNSADYTYSNFPREFSHQIVRDFWLYFLAKDLLHDFNKLYQFVKEQVSQSKSEPYKYQQGQSYPKIDDQKIFLQYRLKVQDKYSDCAIVLMTNYFVLLKGNMVEKRISYDEYVPFPDKSDNRKLFLNGQKETIWLQLKEANTAQALLRHLIEGRSVLMRYKLSQLVKDIELHRGYCA